ncbi:MAG: ATP-dependent DNA helicase RecG [Oscillospiraceae bacterium]|nr:ATP-dependent DNA helicase RecG [Oscillospiraceae bacterium]
MSEADYQALLVPVSRLTAVSQRRTQMLARLNVHTILDLLRLFPRQYEDWTRLLPIADLPEGTDVVFKAEVARAPALQRRGRQSTVRTVLKDDSGMLKAVWFNQPWQADKLSRGLTAYFRGRLRRYNGSLEIMNPVVEAVSEAESQDEPVLRLHPVYPLTAGLTQGVLRNLIAQCLDQYLDYLPDALPAELRRRYHLCEAGYAYRQIHFPADQTAHDLARRRLAFEELFLTQLGLRRLKSQEDASHEAPSLALTPALEQSWQDSLRQLPFSLTGAQARVLAQISQDLSLTRPMSRLIQGDVGSGKTVIAGLALLQAVLAGHQGVLMAPTSVLATQHYHSLQKLFPELDWQLALLTGQTPAKQRRMILAGLESGSIDVLVGTHALLEDQVRFAALGLAVTDEQHRFGVRQRLRLASDPQGRHPHVLVMSATPIPRSLGLILYGDLDISRLDEMPPGRQPVATYTAGRADWPRVRDLLIKHLAQGEQAYLVCPLVQENEQLGDLLAAETVWQKLSADPLLAPFKPALLHGQMKAREKQAAMDAFSRGEAGLLIATTVIEVGVDNPNATLMLILNAERFGLATLHQLRGRVGRGDKASVCILFSDVPEGLARRRLRLLCHTHDGFQVAEADLKLRGPGDFFGTRQHGVPDFRLANLYEDQDLLQESQAAVTLLLQQDPQLQQPADHRLTAALNCYFGWSMTQPGL